ncbi:MAG: hypothetical protein A3G81_05095 [Betaproteobacteria bacterium RIFCSPLOWO2_12_FULL_65_14]|nr:MAG: hypothetical protein A3G81_05095 [Betaproteobacteria bacterium RIFCSPLOWO2_12_FULL_65_14]
MSTQNPYVAPRAAVDDAPEEYQPVKVFSVSGRIGRARYIAYTLGISLLLGIVGGALSAATGEAAIYIAYAAIFVISIMLTIQRSHDFNATGWLAILGLVPLVNLIFWFIPGTDGQNRFGAKTPPNGVLTLIAVWIIPVVFILGIVAAVSIPAYQDYVKRSQQR